MHVSFCDNSKTNVIFILLYFCKEKEKFKKKFKLAVKYSRIKKIWNLKKDKKIFHFSKELRIVLGGGKILGSKIGCFKNEN